MSHPQSRFPHQSCGLKQRQQQTCPPNPSSPVGTRSLLQPNQQATDNYRRLFPPTVTARGPLIPPQSDLARHLVMGNSESYDCNLPRDPGCYTNNGQSSKGGHQKGGREQEKPRSNLSVLLSASNPAPENEQQSTSRSREDSVGALVEKNSPETFDEADSASGLPLMMMVTRSAPSIILPPPAILRRLTHQDANLLPPVAPPLESAPPPPPPPPASLKPGTPPNQGEEDVRRCLSSKELGTLAPPSGSPYLHMLHNRKRLENDMRERLIAARVFKPSTGDRSDAPPEDDSTNSSRRSRISNETRNRRRAEHNQAVISDLCEIVTDLFVAEAKLLKPTTYGVESSNQREHVLKSVQKFLSSLPPRYALGADTPSEVLVHMRLMAAARADPGRAVVHIVSLENDNNWTKAGSSQPFHSVRLVTIACGDAVGLLEYISKILATGGSRVLDADVMLSKDNIVLDRFVVQMNGRLRFDKLAESIETFLRRAKEKMARHAHPESSGESSGKSTNSSIGAIPAGPLYFHPPAKHIEMPSPDAIQYEMEGAVPLSHMLVAEKKRVASPGSPRVPLRVNSLPTILRRQHSCPMPTTTSRSSFIASPSSVKKKSDESTISASNTHQAVDEQESMQQQQQEEVVHTNSGGDVVKSARGRHQKRPLERREGSSGLDWTDDEKSCTKLDFVTVPTPAVPSSYSRGSSSGTEITRVVPLIPFDKLMLIETIGMGRVTTIYRAAWQHDFYPAGGMDSNGAPNNVQMVALKVAMVNPESGDTSNVEEVRREADIAARLQHPNICDIVGVAADQDCFCLAYEFCEGGSLFSLLADTSRYYEYLPIALDIANGMAYLHSRNVIHRDLKPSNILLTRDHRAKIADFGMSVANTGQELTAETGTYRYMAPEVIRHESYSSNADVYSFGVCLWQLITREVPFATMTPIQAAYAVAEGRRPIIPKSTPRRLQEIITACWDQDSNVRPSFTYIAFMLADYAKMAFSPANVGAQTLQIANEMLANVEGNSTVNVDFTATVSSEYFRDGSSLHSDVGLEI